MTEPVSGNSRPSGESLLCRTGERVLAVALDLVIETMRPMPAEPFAGGPAFLTGLARIRGEVVPVLDLGLLLGATAARPSRYVTIKVDEAHRCVALAVESVIGVHQLDPASLAVLPPVLGFLPEGSLKAIGTLDDDLLLVLGSAHLVPDSVWSSLDERVGAS